jgi:hypothetical protein
MRPRHKSRVTDDTHPAECHAWYFKVVHNLKKRLISIQDKPRHRVRQSRDSAGAQIRDMPLACGAQR